MSRHNFAYFAREGAYNMFSHGFMSFAAIGITVACLLIMGTFTLVAVNANAMLEDMESTNQMLAFVDESLTEEEARALEDDLLAVPNVRAVTFISNAQAAEEFRARYEDEELFQGLPDDNFRHRFAIELVDIGYMSETREAIEAVPGIGEGNVNAYEDEAAGFITLRNVAGVVCVRQFRGGRRIRSVVSVGRFAGLRLVGRHFRFRSERGGVVCAGGTHRGRCVPEEEARRCVRKIHSKQSDFHVGVNQDAM